MSKTLDLSVNFLRNKIKENEKLPENTFFSGGRRNLVSYITYSKEKEHL